jgi:hypothetical protein
VPSAALTVPRLFQWNLPQLLSHFQLLGLSTEVVVSQWFMTVFAYAVLSLLSLVVLP